MGRFRRTYWEHVAQDWDNVYSLVQPPTPTLT
jgi:hypothetical protein